MWPPLGLLLMRYRSLAYWDPDFGLTQYGRTKHIVRTGAFELEPKHVNESLCGVDLPRPVNSYAANEYPECTRCARVLSVV